MASALLKLVFLLSFILAILVGMGAHLYYCVAENWIAMLLVGLFIPPVGVIHGLGLLVGFW